MQKSLIIAAFILFLSPLYGMVPHTHFSTNEEYVASILYTESLGESDYGRGLVATVMWVRANGDASKIHRICKIPKQFAVPQKAKDDDWLKCHELVKQMYQGKFKPLAIITPNGDAIHPDHFYVHQSPMPFWARGRWKKRVGKLAFLRLDKFRME